MFTRLATWCHDRLWLVLGIWIAAIVVSNGIAGSVGEDYRQDFKLPGADSTAGSELFAEQFDQDVAFNSGTIVFQAEQGVDDPDVQQPMQALRCAAPR